MNKSRFALKIDGKFFTLDIISGVLSTVVGRLDTKFSNCLVASDMFSGVAFNEALKHNKNICL